MSAAIAFLFAAIACVALAACRPEPTAGIAPSAPGAADADGATRNAELEPHPGTAAQAVDDVVLTTRVKARLAEADLDVGGINVSSSLGQVTLSGAVPVEQIARADAVVREVDGVVEVINALEPSPAAASTPPS